MGYRNDYFNDEKNKGNRGWYTCVRCGKNFRKGDIDIDHILPQSYGGSDSLDNLQCMCKHCNRSKGNDLDDSYDDYIENSIRRDDPDTSDLNKALNKGGRALMKWFKG